MQPIKLRKPPADRGDYIGELIGLLLPLVLIFLIAFLVNSNLFYFGWLQSGTLTDKLNFRSVLTLVFFSGIALAIVFQMSRRFGLRLEWGILCAAFFWLFAAFLTPLRTFDSLALSIGVSTLLLHLQPTDELSRWFLRTILFLAFMLVLASYFFLEF